MTVSTLRQMAAVRRGRHCEIDTSHTERHWLPEFKTFVYHTHIAIAGQDARRCQRLAERFYHTASLSALPWYAAFLGGCSQPLQTPPSVAIDKHQLCWARFDLGLGQPRYYRQLVSMAAPDKATWVVAARSVDDGPPLPQHAVLAYTLGPNGELVHWDARHQLLHWHHICCTPGAAMLPGRWDRYLMNALRGCGLDRAERTTYREEAEQMRNWLQSPQSQAFLQ